MGFRRKHIVPIGSVKRQMKDDLRVRFSRAFFGGGSDYDKAVTAFEVSDYYAAFDRHDVAYLYDKIAEFYNLRYWNTHIKSVDEISKENLDS